MTKKYVPTEELPPERKELLRRHNQRHALFSMLLRVTDEFKLDPEITHADKTHAAVIFAAITVAAFHATQRGDLNYVMTKEDITHAVSMFRKELMTVRESVLEDVGIRGKLN